MGNTMDEMGNFVFRDDIIQTFAFQSEQQYHKSECKTTPHMNTTMQFCRIYHCITRGQAIDRARLGQYELLLSYIKSSQIKFQSQIPALLIIKLIQFIRKICIQSPHFSLKLAPYKSTKMIIIHPCSYTRNKTFR